MAGTPKRKPITLAAPKRPAGILPVMPKISGQLRLVIATVLCTSQYWPGRKRYQPGPWMNVPMMMRTIHITRQPERHVEIAKARSVEQEYAIRFMLTSTEE